jgi:hypothetical protein
MAHINELGTVASVFLFCRVLPVMDLSASASPAVGAEFNLIVDSLYRMKTWLIE